MWVIEPIPRRVVLVLAGGEEISFLTRSPRIGKRVQSPHHSKLVAIKALKEQNLWYEPPTAEELRWEDIRASARRIRKMEKIK